MLDRSSGVFLDLSLSRQVSRELLAVDLDFITFNDDFIGSNAESCICLAFTGLDIVSIAMNWAGHQFIPDMPSAERT